MTDLEYDVYKTVQLSKRLGGYNPNDFNQYGRIYQSSNEDLKTLFSCIDVEKKDVLSVLSSGDQALYCYSGGAEKVDVFDINKLTIYYYVLRLWSLKYLKSTNLGCDTFYYNTAKLLEIVKPKTKIEKSTYEYWSLVLKKIPRNYFGGIFTNGNPYNNLSSLNLDRATDDMNINFYNMDISDEVSCCQQKYDVLILSNIHEYVPITKFEHYIDNILSLLNGNGLVLISNFDYEGINREKRWIFSKEFHIEDVPYNFGNVLIKK